LLQSFEALGPSPDGLAFVGGMRLRSAIFALSNLASWSTIPSMSSPRGFRPRGRLGTDLRLVLLEPRPQQVMVGGLAGEAVPVLRKHY
jgi:hypothetical protein